MQLFGPSFGVQLHQTLQFYHSSSPLFIASKIQTSPKTWNTNLEVSFIKWLLHKVAKVIGHLGSIYSAIMMCFVALFENIGKLNQQNLDLRCGRWESCVGTMSKGKSGTVLWQDCCHKTHTWMGLIAHLFYRYFCIPFYNVECHQDQITSCMFFACYYIFSSFHIVVHFGIFLSYLFSYLF